MTDTVATRRCVFCHSPHVTWSTYEGPTGVVAPDGGQEIRAESGFYCENCRRWADEVEEDDDETNVIS